MRALVGRFTTPTRVAHVQRSVIGGAEPRRVEHQDAEDERKRERGHRRGNKVYYRAEFSDD